MSTSPESSEDAVSDPLPDDVSESADSAVPTTDQYIAFNLGDYRLLCSLEHVDEIVDVMPLNVIPGTMSWFQGLGAHKGRLLPVSDLGAYAGFADSMDHPDSRLLIINSGSERIGLAVDEVLGLVDAAVNAKVAADAESAAGDNHPSIDELPQCLLNVLLDRLALDGQDTALLNLAGILEQPDFLAIAASPVSSAHTSCQPEAQA